MALPSDKELLALLKSHGLVALFTYLRFHKKDVKELLNLWNKTEPSNHLVPDAKLRCFFASFVGQYLPRMMSDTTKGFFYWNEDQKLDYYAITPPLQLFLKASDVSRRSIFYDSLNIGDILVGRVCKNSTPNEYKIHILFFTDGRNYHIADLNIYMYMKKHKFMDFAVGSYLRVAFCDGDLAARKLFVTNDPGGVKTATGVEIVLDEQLGPIEYDELPLSYQMSEKELRSYDSYFTNPECKISSLKKVMGMFNLNNNRIYSIQPNVESATAPPPTNVLGYEAEKRKLVETYTDNARTTYNAQNVIPSLTIVNDALEIDPDNISLLMDRAAIYGTIHHYEKAYSDLSRVADMDLSNPRALEYLRDLVIVMAEWYESKEQYMAAISSLLKVWKVPAFRTDEEIMDNIIHLTSRMLVFDSEEIKLFTTEAPKLKTYSAVFDYAAEDDDEVSFVRGDIIFNCYAVNDGWLTGTVQRTGNTGMLPASYADLIN